MQRTSLLILFMFLSQCIYCQQHVFINPILPGAYPDPSICRVGDDYYLVNSSFEYFPGLPIHHSKDLINWELIGYGLHRTEQCSGVVNLVDVQSDGGIHAPTIRHHNGTFYIITTNVYYDEKRKETDFVNFIITAQNPAGPWSEPHVLASAPGIDPDIFFDDDGKVWYVGTHSPENPNFPGEGEIWLQEIDLTNWQLTGERSYLWRGACGGVWAEGPHLYKRKGAYYLMIAEGGTSYNHAMMIATSAQIRGPYVANDRNPILTTRHLSYDNWVHSTGHADLLELPDGRWYMVALGVRGDEERGSNMGRETYLLPVQWEKEPFAWKAIQYEWPVVAPQTGKVERFTPVPFPGTTQKYTQAFADNFDSGQLNPEWNFRRVPTPGTYSLQAKQGYLRLFAHPATIQNRGSASLLGFRQKESDFQYRASMTFQPTAEGCAAGVSIVQKDDNHITFAVIQKNKQVHLQLTLAEPNQTQVLVKEAAIPDYRNTLVFKIESRDHSYSFSYSLTGAEGPFMPFAETPANRLLSKGYTGAYLGLYATGNGLSGSGFADFDWVDYQGYLRLLKDIPRN